MFGGLIARVGGALLGRAVSRPKPTLPAPRFVGAAGRTVRDVALGAAGGEVVDRVVRARSGTTMRRQRRRRRGITQKMMQDLAYLRTQGMSVDKAMGYLISMK